MNLARQSKGLLHALETWQKLWCEALEQLADDDRKWLGVANNVSDLAHLTRRIIEVAAGPQASSSRYLQRIPSFGTRDLHEFMRVFVPEG
jgi:hypothetical protein